MKEETDEFRARTLVSMRALMALGDNPRCIVVSASTQDAILVIDENNLEGRTVKLNPCAAVKVTEQAGVAELYSWRAGYDALTRTWYCTAPQYGACYDPKPPLVIIGAQDAARLFAPRKLLEE